MNIRRPNPPQDDAPREADLGAGTRLDLPTLAAAICGRYRAEFPDEHERYGEVGIAWCVHDNQHLLNWAALTVTDQFDMQHEVAWLANVLQARNFPVDRLARNLDIGADVVRAAVTTNSGEQLAAVLADAAAFVRSGSFADYDDE